MQKKVYIVHGFEAYPSKHWFFWLKEELAKSNAETYIPHLPNANNPKPEEWLSCLQECTTQNGLDGQTYFVGHSLGCLGVLHFLQTLALDSKIGGFILVSGFDSPLELYPPLEAFTQIPLQYEKLISLSENRLVISARDDCIVPTQLSYNLAQNLKSDFVQTKSGQHFMQEDGIKQFPLLLHWLTFFFKN